MTIKENVEMILRKDVKSRGCDKRLIMLYWKDVDEVDFLNFEEEFISKSTSSESIRRVRQLIQEEGRYLPSDEIVLLRRLRRVKMKDSIVNNRDVI